MVPKPQGNETSLDVRQPIMISGTAAGNISRGSGLKFHKSLL